MGLLNVARGLMHLPSSALGWTCSKVVGGSRNEQQPPQSTASPPAFAAASLKEDAATHRIAAMPVGLSVLLQNPVLSQKEAAILVASIKLGQEGASIGSTHADILRTRSPSPEYESALSLESSPPLPSRPSFSPPPPTRTGTPDARFVSMKQKLLVAAGLAPPRASSVATPAKTPDSAKPGAPSVRDQDVTEADQRKKEKRAKKTKKAMKASLTLLDVDYDKLRAIVAQTNPSLVSCFDCIWKQGGKSPWAIAHIVLHQLALVEANQRMNDKYQEAKSRLNRKVEDKVREAREAEAHKEKYKAELLCSEARVSQLKGRLLRVAVAESGLQPRSYHLTDCPDWIDEEPQASLSVKPQVIPHVHCRVLPARPSQSRLARCTTWADCEA